MNRKTGITVLYVVLGVLVGSHVCALAQEKTCSNATLKGSYGYTGTQFTISPPAIAGPFATVGRQVFDGQGNTTAAGTTSVNGNMVKVTFTGTYNVNADCTGSMTILVSPVSITGHYDFVIDDDGAEVRVIGTDPGAVGTVIVRKQFLSRGGASQ
jgi:hypothetical protein